MAMDTNQSNGPTRIGDPNDPYYSSNPDLFQWNNNTQTWVQKVPGSSWGAGIDDYGNPYAAGTSGETIGWNPDSSPTGNYNPSAEARRYRAQEAAAEYNDPNSPHYGDSEWLRQATSFFTLRGDGSGSVNATEDARWAYPAMAFENEDMTGGAQRAEIERARRREAIQASQDNYKRDRQKQLEYLQELQRTANDDPWYRLKSRSQQDLRAQVQQAQGAAGSMAAGARNVGGGAAMSYGAQQADQIARQGRASSLMLSEQEKRAAQQAMAQQYQQMMQQDANYANFMASQGYGNEAANDNYAQTMYQQGLSATNSGLQRGRDTAATFLGMDLQAAELARKQQDQWIQAIGSAAGAAGNMFGSFGNGGKNSGEGW